MNVRSGPARTTGASRWPHLRRVEQLANVEPEDVCKPDQRAQRQRVAAGLDALQIVLADADFLGELGLREPARAAQLGNATSDVLLQLREVPASHAAQLARFCAWKTC